jgi:hypothetical protein
MTFEPGNVPTGYSEAVTRFVAGFPWASLEDGSLLTDAGTETAAGGLKYAAARAARARSASMSGSGSW